MSDKAADTYPQHKLTPSNLNRCLNTRTVLLTTQQLMGVSYCYCAASSHQTQTQIDCLYHSGLSWHTRACCTTWADLKQGEVGRAGDVPDNACGSLNAHIQQWGRDGSKGCVTCPGLARGPALPHQGRSCPCHDGTHICKVHIDQPWHLQRVEGVMLLIKSLLLNTICYLVPQCFCHCAVSIRIALYAQGQNV